MKNSTEYSKQISDFIYDKPELVAVLLTKYGYSVSTENKRLIQILNELNKDTFELLYAGNEAFANDLAGLMINEGYVYADGIASSMINFGSAIIGSYTAGNQAQKQREFQANLTNAQLSSQEKLGYETLQTNAETQRINNITSNVSAYASALNTESQKRVTNTWIYLAVIGGMFAIFLLLKKKTSK